MDENGTQQLASAKEQDTATIHVVEETEDEDMEENIETPVTNEVFGEYIRKKQDCQINMTVLPLFLGIAKEEDHYVPKSLVVNFNQPNSPLIHSMINKLAGDPLEIENDTTINEQDFRISAMDMFLYNVKHAKVGAYSKVRYTLTKISKCQLCICLYDS